VIPIKSGEADDIWMAGGKRESVAANHCPGPVWQAKRAVLVGLLSAIAILSMPTEEDAHLFGVLHAVADALAETIHLPDFRLPDINNILFHEPDNFL
jgi:hypothetical protein